MENIDIDLDDLMSEMDNVPFGNSRFQAEHFTDGMETPERRYRHVMLQLRQRIGALNAASFGRRRMSIDVAELNAKIPDLSDYDLERAEIDLEEKEWQLRDQETLIEDAMIDVQNYRRLLEDLPKPTREQFEAAEPAYWRKRLIGEAKLQYQSTGRIDAGWLMALDKIGIVVRREALPGDEEQIRFLDKKLLIPTGGNHK